MKKITQFVIAMAVICCTWQISAQGAENSLYYPAPSLAQRALPTNPAAGPAGIIPISPTQGNEFCAVTHSPYITEMEQPNGQTFQGRILTDGKITYLETVDGYTVMQDPADKYFKYAAQGVDGGLYLSNVKVSAANRRTAQETRTLNSLNTHSRFAGEPLRERLVSASASRIPSGVSVQSVFPNSGVRKSLLLLIDYPDQAATYTNAEFNNLSNQVGYNVNGQSGSFRDFYLAASYGTLTINTDVSGWYTAANNRATYGVDDINARNFLNAVPLIREAVDAAEAAGVNYADYDGDGDGAVDVVMVIHSGRGSEESGNAADIWSHRWVLAANGQSVTYDGKLINDYIIQAEKYGSVNITNIGVMCHEFGHALGLPDLYDANGGSEGLGNWCLMAGGTWNNSGKTPAHPSIYCKDEMGWMTPTLLTGSGTITNMDYSQSSGEAYRLNTLVGTEYFLIENRQNFGWDAFLPGSGLCIYHIDRSIGDNTNPTRYRVDLEQGDGLRNLNLGVNRGDAGDTFPGSSNNTIFNCVSNPNSKTYNGNESDANIYDIVSQAANKMEFKYFTAADYTALPDISVNAGVQSGLGSGTPIGGVYSGPGVTDDGNGTTYSFDPAAAGVGVHTLNYSFSFAPTPPGFCADIASDNVEVLPAAGVTFTAPADMCIDAGDQAGLGGGAPAGGIYSGPGVFDDGNGNTYTFKPAVAGVGTHTLTYTQGGTPATDNVEVFALDDASFNYSAGSYCTNAADPTPTITGLAGGTFSSTAGLSLNAGTGTIDVSASTPGAYTVTYTTAGTCPNSSSVGVTINALDDASFNYSAGSYCTNAVDPTPTITGLAGGTFSSTAGLSLNAGTGTIDVSASTPGTYTVTYTTTGACPNSSSVTVTINTLDDASFNYSAGSYCISAADPTPTITGVAGGTFSSTAGLSINISTGTIDLSASTPGTYTVTYTTTGACPNSSSVSVTINTLDDASFNYSAGSYCISAADPTPTITGVAGGTFSSTAGLSINVSTGTIDLSASTPGTYTVTYTTTGACANSSSVSVTINTVDDASFSYSAGSYCADAADPTPTITGVPGGIFSSTAGLSINPATGTIDLSASTPATYSVTYTTTGACANSSSVNVAINALPTVTFTAPPSPVCPGEILTGQGGGTPVGGAYSGPGVTDDGNGTTYTFNAGTAGNGTHTITYNYTDGNGCSGSATDTVTVEDTTPPVITCPGNITQNNDPGVCNAVVTYAMPTVTDNCGNSGSLSTLFASNNGGTPGGAVYFDVTVGGNNLIINSLEVNTGEFPGNTFSLDVYTIPVTHVGNETNAGLWTLVGSGSGTAAGANNPSLAVLSTPFTLDAATSYGIAIVLDASHGHDYSNGNGGNQNYSNANLSMSLGSASNTPFGAVFTPRVFNGTIIYSIPINQTAGLPSGSNFPVGTTTNTFEAIDASGNTSSCSFDVIVQDTELPVANCAAPFTIQLDAAGNASIVVGDIENGSTDNCGIATTTIDKLSFTCADVGANTVTLTVTDGNGNVSTCTTVVTVEDNVPPTITCPGDITVNNDLGICGAIVNYTVTATDNCGSGGSSSQTFTYTGAMENFTVPAGVTSIDVTSIGAGGADGNFASTAGEGGRIDATIPVTPGEILNIYVGGSGLPASSGGTGGFNGGGNGAPGTASAYSGGGGGGASDIRIAPYGLADRIIVAAGGGGGGGDGCTGFGLLAGNGGGLTGTGGDAGAMCVCNPSGLGGSQVAGGIVGSWACGANCNATPGSFGVGGSGNTTTVCGGTTGGGGGGAGYYGGGGGGLGAGGGGSNYFIPTATAVTNITGGQTGNGLVTITWSSAATTVTQTAGLPSGSVFPIGTTTNTFVATDGAGNTATCSFDVTVNDTEPPVANCAPAFTLQLDASGNASITLADIENGSTDNCGIATTTIDKTDFTCADVGPNTVTLTVTDVNGNVSTCTTIVTVEDSILPTIFCPADITANTDLGECFATVSFATPVAFDNCGIDTIVQTMGDPSGSTFPVGVNTIEFTATDVNGNTSTCSFTITVTDNEAPVAVCQNITIQLDAAGNATIVAADVDGGSTDQCGVASTTIDINTFDCSDVGDNNVILTVTDVNGNTSTCTAVVTVEDVTAPTVVCQDITVELDPVTGTITIAGIDVDGGSTDVCGIDTYTLDMDTFDCSNVGDNLVTLTVTDVNGNSATCTAIVTVEDNTSPVLVCQDFTLELGADGTATLDPSDVIASNDDACGIFTSAVDITDFDCADIGAPITVQVFTIDVNGNLASCTAEVTVVDLLAPEITCPADQTVDPGPGNIFYILPDYFATGEATAIDNCTDPVTITTQSPAAGTPLADGTYTITLTATDEYGNTSTCDFELIVESVLGVGDNNQNLGSIKMYPVPAKNILNISNPQSLELERLEIYDLRGRLVQVEDLRGMGSVKTLNIDQLAAASYYVKINGANGEITKRLLKE